MDFFTTTVTARRKAPWQSIALALTLTLSANAFAQSAPAATSATATQHIQAMSTDKQATAFFYQNPVVLDREQHKALHIKALNASFAAHNQAVPVVAAEFAAASQDYPIVFNKGADGIWGALALTGLQPNTNAFVDAKGQWSAHYVPASVRRYPFILAEGPEQKLSLAVDLAATEAGGKGPGLFTDKGEPSELVNQIMPMLADFQAQAKQTADMGKALKDAGVLVQQNLQVRLSEAQQANVQGVWIVDEAKLRALPDDKVLALFKNGELAAVYAHMLSLRNLVPLLERSQPAIVKPRKTKDK